MTIEKNEKDRTITVRVGGSVAVMSIGEWSKIRRDAEGRKRIACRRLYPLAALHRQHSAGDFTPIECEVESQKQSANTFSATLALDDPVLG